MEFLSERIKTMAASATLAMTQRSRELKNQGFDVISLSIGEPDFDTPEYVKAAGKKAIDDNFSRYSPVSGYEDIKAAISEKFKRENGLDYAPNQIVVSAGGKHSIINVIMVTVDPGDEVIIMAPYWVSYYDQIKLAGGIPVTVNASIESDFKIKPEDLHAAITDKTKLIIFNSPSNPTGMVYTREEIEKIAKVVEKHPNVLILSDEIYEHIIFEGEHVSMASFKEIYDRTITCNGVSKAYAMTGWRVGYLGGPVWLAKAVDKLQGQFTSGICSIAQKAACAALKSDDGSIKKMKDAFRRRRDLICKLLKEVEGVKISVPQGAFYVMPDISSYIGKSDGERIIRSADDMAFFLLDKARVAVVGGDSFGAPDCIRISYATSDDLLVEAVKRIKEALKQLR